MDNFEAPISLDTPPAQQGGISLSQNTAPQVSPGVTASRADKAALGLSGTMAKQPEDIKASVATNEDGFRKEAAATVDYNKAQQKQNLVAQILRTGGEVDPKKLAEFMVPSLPTDPKSVIEENYGRAFVSPIMNMADSFMKETSMAKAMQHIPQQANDAFNAGADMASKSEYTRKLRDDMKAIYDNQPWAMWGAQTAAGMIPGFSEAALSTRYDSTLSPFSAVVEGSSLEQQRQNRWNQPFNEFKSSLDEDFEALKKNPQLGLQYLQAMVGQSTSDVVLNNTQSLMDLSILGGPALKAAKTVLGFSKLETLHGEVIQGVKDVVKATEAVKDGPVYEMSPEEYSWENEGGAVRRDVDVVRPDAVGNVEEAAVKQSAKNTLATINHTTDPTSITIQSLPTVYKKDQRGIKTNPGNYGQEIVNRQAESTAAHIDEITSVIKDTAKVNRVPELQVSEEAQALLRQKVKDDHPELSGNIMNVDGPHWDKAINGWNNNLVLGKHTGEFFRSVSEAKNWAKVNRIPLATTEKIFTEKTTKKVGDKLVPGPTRILKEPDTKIVTGARIRQKGFGFYVEMPVPVDLRSDIVRDIMGTTEFSKLPHSIAPNLVDDLIGWLRNPDEGASMDDRINRKIATSAPSNYMEVARAAIQDIVKISPAGQKDLTRGPAAKRWAEWGRVVVSTKDMIDPATGEKGYDFKNPGEVENAYLNIHNRLPSKEEIQAYFAFKRINADDLMYRSLSMMRNKHNVGAMSHRFQVTGKDGKQMFSPWVDGVRLNELPGGRDTIAVFKRSVDHTHLMPANMMGKAREEIAEEVKTGRAMVYEVYDPDNTPLKGFGGLTEENQVRYVVARGFETRPLNLLDQINRRGGGHIEYDYPHYLKQADMVQDPTTKRWRYRGDKTALALPNNAMGEGFAKKLNDLKPLIKAGRLDEAKSLYESYFDSKEGNIPVSWEDHIKHYKPAQEGKRPRWSTDDPFVVVPADKTIADMPILWKELEERYNGPDKDNPMFEDGSRHGSLAKQNQIQYTGQRDAYELNEVQDVGKRHNPVYKYAPAKTVDSVPMQMRALARIINDYAGLADQKMFAIEHWLFGDADGKGNGAEHYIQTDNKNDIRYSPFYYYNNYKFIKGTTFSEESTMEQQHYKSKAFAGIPSKTDNYLRSTAQKLADTVYNKFGPKGSELDPSWMLPYISDGPRFVRSVVFHPKMGLFNPAMFLVHLSTYINVSAIAGLRPSASGSFATILHGWTAVNKTPAVMKYLDRLASKGSFGGYDFKPGQWQEAYDGMMRYGANRIEPTQLSDLDNPTSARILQNSGSNFLDLGLTPFKAGIKPVKIASWYVAYLERRNGGGGKFNWEPTTGKLSDSDWGQIHERADILSHNMTRASTSAPQKLFASIPFQFQGYDLRVMELLTGKRLTKTEKARMLGTYMTMYGVPAAGGIIGLSTLIRNWASTPTENSEGYVPGSDFTSTMIMEGLLGAGIGTLTGGGDIRKGNIYNFGQRWGMRDMSVMDALLDGDSNIWNIWGAAPNEIANTIAASTPFRNWGMSMLKGDGKFKLTPEHVMGMLKEVSSINAMDRAYWGAVAHRWVSRNGRTIASDVSTTNALFMSIAGLQEQRFSDAYPVGQVIKHMKEQENKAFGQAVKEATLGFQSVKDGNSDQADKYFLNAQFYMQGYPEDKWNEVVAASLKENKDMVDVLAMERYMGKALPIEQRKKAMDTYSNILRMQNERSK